MVAVAGGDLSGMSTIYQNRRRPLFRFFFRLTGRQEASEDLVHEVFMRMIRYRHTYEASSETGLDGFEAWMYRIARNTLADQRRKHRLETPAGEGELEAMPSGRLNPFETATKQQDLALLYRAMRQLSDDKRELLVLARFQGLSYDQIGKIVGCEANTVKGRMFRAMKELSELYSNLSQEKAS